MKSHSRVIIWLLSAVGAALGLGCWSCSLFHPPQAPSLPPESHPSPQPAAPVTVAPIRRKPHPKPVLTKKQAQPPSSLPTPSPAPMRAPVVTLGSSADAKANAQRLIDQATSRLEHLDRAELSEASLSRYEQANELLVAARRSLADQDYPAASSLAEKASALLNELPSQRKQ